VGGFVFLVWCLLWRLDRKAMPDWRQGKDSAAVTIRIAPMAKKPFSYTNLFGYINCLFENRKGTII
jgi:hypothetical protein